MSIGVALVVLAGTAVGNAFGERAVWTNTGPYDLDLTSIVTCPSNGKRVYADSFSTSVLRSDDRGQSWTDAGFGEPGVTSVALAVDPRDDDVVYASDGSRLAKSTDGGDSWKDLPSNIAGGDNFNNREVSSILVFPGPPSILFVVSQGLYKSADDGNTFSKVPGITPDSIEELFVSPTDPSKLYGLGFGSLFESTDAGSSWQTLFSQQLLSFAPAPSDVATLYVADQEQGEFKSSDGGATWTRLVGSPLAHFLAVDPGDSQTVYAAPASGQISRTTDGGTTWEAFSDGIPSGETWTALAALRSSPTRILAAGLSGLYELTYGFEFWSAERTGLAFDSANLLAVSAGESPTLYATVMTARGSDTAGIPVITVEVKPSLATTWDLTKLAWSVLEARVETDLPAIVADPTDPNQAWVSEFQRGEPSWLGGTLWRTTDAGADWSVVTPPGKLLPFESLAIRPGSPDVLFGGLATYTTEPFGGTTAGGGVMSSTDGGATWSDVGVGLPVQSVRSIGVSSSDAGLILVGLDSDGTIPSEAPPPMIYRTTNGGLTWSPTGPTFVSQTSVNGLIIDPRNPANIIACASIYQGNSILLRSLDGGVTWTSTPLPFYLSGLAIDPRSSSTLYAAAQSDGVLVSHDGGTTWNPFGAGLEGVWANAIAIESSGEVLHAATSSGVFDMQLPSVVTVPGFSPSILSGRSRP